MKRNMIAVGLMACLGANASAQAPQPYAGFQERPIKALSEQQVADLKGGARHGPCVRVGTQRLPGPSHLLELAPQLDLSSDQQAAIRSLFDAMKAEVIPIGESLIDQEKALDRLFTSHTVTPEALQVATAQIGETQARLREAHLKYHLSTVGLLQRQQLERHAARLRGWCQRTSSRHAATELERCNCIPLMRSYTFAT
jgi:hypothetical protein